MGKNGVGAAIWIALGLAVAGALVGWGFQQGRKPVRSVVVKGYAEREVKADLALWPLRFVASGNELGAVQSKIEKDGEVVAKFLRDAGFSDDEFETQSLQVIDLDAQQYGRDNRGARFIIAQFVLVRSQDVDKLQATAARSGKLLAQCVVLSAEYGPLKPIFLFGGLDALKTDMLAEATQMARDSAGEFAKQSESHLGGILKANQGVFQILPRDPAPGISESDQLQKTVRVVSTIEYLLED